ncbi:MAG: hypothetical protein NVSMB47_17960 [Polyangiales bacterium]
MLDAVQSPHTGLLDLGASVVTLAGQAELTGSVALGVAIARLRHRRRDWAAPLAIAVVVLGESLLKLVLPQAPPPHERARSIELLPSLQVPFGFSYPSGHVARVAFLLIALRVPAVLSLVGLALMAATRVYLADHWPSDVAGGLLLGAAVAWAVRTAPAGRSVRLRGR